MPSIMWQLDFIFQFCNYNVSARVFKMTIIKTIKIKEDRTNCKLDSLNNNLLIRRWM